MRWPRQTNRESAMLDGQLTPLIDVIFLMQIFFLCTAGFSQPERLLESRLPTSGEAKPAVAPVGRVVLRIELSGPATAVRTTLNGQPIADAAALAGRLRALGAVDATLPVVLQVAETVPLGAVVTAYDAARAAGFETVQFAARRDAPRS